MLVWKSKGLFYKHKPAMHEDVFKAVKLKMYGVSILPSAVSPKQKRPGNLISLYYHKERKVMRLLNLWKDNFMRQIRGKLKIVNFIPYTKNQLQKLYVRFSQNTVFQICVQRYSYNFYPIDVKFYHNFLVYIFLWSKYGFCKMLKTLFAISIF